MFTKVNLALLCLVLVPLASGLTSFTASPPSAINTGPTLSVSTTDTRDELKERIEDLVSAAESSVDDAKAELNSLAFEHANKSSRMPYLTHCGSN